MNTKAQLCWAWTLVFALSYFSYQLKSYKFIPTDSTFILELADIKVIFVLRKLLEELRDCLHGYGTRICYDHQLNTKTDFIRR